MTESPFARETLPANLEQEMRQSYLDYAMSVIVGRALPDVRDGLKPVHRRVLYAMSELGNDWNKPYKKSARIVGDVIGKYHPHGDTAVYDTIVRMAQDFSMRYLLIDGQGNFGSVDGDAPAAMRYTEIRLSRIAHELLSDLDKETVDFGPNYDETETQPLVLPTRVPNLLVNGSTGIAVGMATNIPPHNLREVVGGCLALIDNPEISVTGLMQIIPGPDFPTAGIVHGRTGIRLAYETGRGRINVRARAAIEEEDSGRQSIIVTELPYMVNKARLMEKIAELVKHKKIEGISALRDESDKSGMRLVIEIKRGEQADIVLNNLYKHTRMQTVFGLNMVALSGNQPRLFTLRDMLEEFLRHRREVVTRRTVHMLRKARDRAHILEGLSVALANLDPVIELIRAAQTPAEAKAQLLSGPWEPGIVAAMVERVDSDMTRAEGPGPEYGMHPDGYRLSPEQAQAILDLRLHRLTGLEQEKIRKEYGEIVDHIASLLEILRNPDRLMAIIREELAEIRDRYGDDRRSEIQDGEIDFSMEDLIPEEELVVTLSHAGYAKSQPVSDYAAQRRGGKGRIATRTREEDFVERMFIANSHDTILCFSDRGKVYWLRVFQLPQAGRQARGKPLVNLLPLESGEQVTAILPIKGYDDGEHIFMATSRGTIKKCDLTLFSNPRSNGIIAVRLHEDDHLIGVALTREGDDVLLVSDRGKAVRFAEAGVRSIGRTARGVRGIRLGGDDRVISLMVIPGPDADDPPRDLHVLISTVNGYGKRTPVADFPRKNRGGMGVIAVKTSERNGEVVSALTVSEEDEVMLITDGGTLIRTPVSGISAQGRNTQGVRLISVNTGERLASVSRVDESANGTPEDPSEDGAGQSPAPEPATIH
ncbi:MAG: DNA gyrase subunit A [Gammaproteobacteria bacterium]|nr:DNA gyrase subunit A [Gammaproteobacteria bacterium]MXX16362.1 DNA gyrase subunit A [Gammaproteobacteria bacterium]